MPWRWWYESEKLTTGTYIIYTHDVIKLGGQADAGTPEDQGLRIDGVNKFIWMLKCMPYVALWSVFTQTLGIKIAKRLASYLKEHRILLFTNMAAMSSWAWSWFIRLLLLIDIPCLLCFATIILNCNSALNTFYRNHLHTSNRNPVRAVLNTGGFTYLSVKWWYILQWFCNDIVILNAHKKGDLNKAILK